MLYAILCYNDENTVYAWSEQQDEAVRAHLSVVQDKPVREGKLWPVARLMPTPTAMTSTKTQEPRVVIDGRAFCITPPSTKAGLAKRERP